MITKIDVRNFQSLHRVVIDLQAFTVIVGASSSGKSAFTRAIRTLTSNARGDSFVTHGERTTTITAETDKGVVSLSRGGVNEYTLIPLDPSLKQSYSKLGGAVPEEVTDFLGIQPKDPLNYANQFDMPYLLTSSAGEVARTLGELTNVHTIFESAREANRRKQAANTTLKTRTSDYAIVTEKVETYRSLKAQLAALTLAEEALSNAHEREVDIAAITHYLDAIEHAEAIEARATPEAEKQIPTLDKVEQHQKALARLQSVVETIEHHEAAEARATAITAHQIPSLDSLITPHLRLQNYRDIIAMLKAQALVIRKSTEKITEAEEATEYLENSYLNLLKKNNTCPTCNQSTKDLSHEH